MISDFDGEWKEISRRENLQEINHYGGTRTETRISILNGVKREEVKIYGSDGSIITKINGNISEEIEGNRKMKSKIEEIQEDSDNYPKTKPRTTDPKTAISQKESGDFRKEVLNLINDYRKAHQVQPLRLDDNLNNLAQDWANRLASTGQFQHRPSCKFGENIAMGSGSWGTVKHLVQSWYDEVNNYSFSRNSGSGTGHFTQIVWKNSQLLGVGKAVSSNGSTYLVTNYDPAGNFIGQYQNNVFPKR